MHIKEILSEQIILTKEQREQVVSDFIKFVRYKLHISTKVHIKFSYDADEAQEEYHTGAFNQETKEMWVYMHKRNLVDILRTVAHELTHVKQAQENKLPAQTTPESKEEAEAAAVAGYLIKIYGKDHRYIFE